ncbi:hypothetical protein Tco_1465406 [Tanacetum coccineum]
MVINSPCQTNKKELAILRKTATGKEFSNPLMAVLEYCPLYAIVDGKAVVISESSVRSDLLFNNKDGIVCLTNDEIFENLALMGYEQLSTKLTFQKELRFKEIFNVSKVLDLEKEKDAQVVEIHKLKKRVKKLERKRKSSISHPRRMIYRHVESSDDDLDEEDASKQGRTGDKTKPMFIDSDFDVLDDDMENVEGETVNTATTGVSAVSAPVTTTSVAISTAEPRTPPTTAATAFIDGDLTIAQTLVKMRSEKAKEKGVAFRDQEEATNAALTEEFDEIQARMDANHELAVRLTHEEQEKYTIKERARLLAEYFERRKKQLAAERAEAIRNKPPTRA